MKLPRIHLMEDLFLGIGLIAAFIAVGVWLFHFHLPELLTVYGASAVVGIAYASHLRKRKRH